MKAATHEMAAPSEALWGDIMFHAQRAAEKSMQAFLAWNDIPFGKTHNLEELGQPCVAADVTLAAIAEQASLTEYGWKFRYPGESDDPERSQAERALEVARNIYDAIHEHLPEQPGA